VDFDAVHAYTNVRLGLVLREKHQIKYDPKLHRVRCQGHIINLAVHAFLFNSDADMLDDDTLDVDGVQDQLVMQTTNSLQSNDNTLDHVLPAMDFLLQKFEDNKRAYIDHPVLAPMFNSGWVKLSKYYEMSEDTPVYIAGIIFHPRREWAYIRKNGKPNGSPSRRTY
jgi:hypothetical protein